MKFEDLNIGEDFLLLNGSRHYSHIIKKTEEIVYLGKDSSWVKINCVYNDGSFHYIGPDEETLGVIL